MRAPPGRKLQGVRKKHGLSLPDAGLRSIAEGIHHASPARIQVLANSSRIVRDDPRMAELHDARGEGPVVSEAVFVQVQPGSFRNVRRIVEGKSIGAKSRHDLLCKRKGVALIQKGLPQNLWVERRAGSPRQTHSVPVCSPPSRRVAPLRPRCAGLTAWTPAARTSVPALV